MRTSIALLFLCLILPLAAQDNPSNPVRIEPTDILREIAFKAGIQPYRKPTGNDIVEKKQDAALKAHLDFLYKRDITLNVALKRISEEGFELDCLYSVPFRPTPLHPNAKVIVPLATFLIKYDATAGRFGFLPTNEKKTNLEHLRKGDLAVVKAKIRDAVVISKSGPFEDPRISFRIDLMDAKIVLPPAPGKEPTP